MLIAVPAAARATSPQPSLDNIRVAKICYDVSGPGIAVSLDVEVPAGADPAAVDFKTVVVSGSGHDSTYSQTFTSSQHFDTVFGVLVGVYDLSISQNGTVAYSGRLDFDAGCKPVISVDRLY